MTETSPGPTALPPGWLVRLRQDVDVALERDPAVRSAAEAVLACPGLHAVWGYRLHHHLWTRGHRLAARMLSQWVRARTGIEIHPGAAIGRRLFIDHGMGVVIGETAVIGDDVTLYHDVTLGGRSRDRVKRHPTLGDGVVVGAGARILGPVTIGAGAQVGANAVVVRNVPAGGIVVGVPGVERRGVDHAARLGSDSRVGASPGIDPAMWI